MPLDTSGTQAQNPATQTSGRICRAAEPTSTTDWLSYFVNSGVLGFQDPQAKTKKEQRRTQYTQRSGFFFVPWMKTEAIASSHQY